MNMKNLICLSGIFCSIVVTGQEKLTNDLIWNSRTFNAEGISQGPSMKDGMHYTLKKHNENIGDYIVKYSYETGDSVALIASSLSIFQDAKKSFDGYQFSADEKQLLVDIMPITTFTTLRIKPLNPLMQRQGNDWPHSVQTEKKLPMS
jgi:hypothetical protein